MRGLTGKNDTFPTNKWTKIGVDIGIRLDNNQDRKVLGGLLFLTRTVYGTFAHVPQELRLGVGAGPC